MIAWYLLVIASVLFLKLSWFFVGLDISKFMNLRISLIIFTVIGVGLILTSSGKYIILQSAIHEHGSFSQDFSYVLNSL